MRGAILVGAAGRGGGGAGLCVAEGHVAVMTVARRCLGLGCCWAAVRRGRFAAGAEVVACDWPVSLTRGAFSGFAVWGEQVWRVLVILGFMRLASSGCAVAAAAAADPVLPWSAFTSSFTSAWSEVVLVEPPVLLPRPVALSRVRMLLSIDVLPEAWCWS